jgi:hypothetical protein
MDSLSSDGEWPGGWIPRDDATARDHFDPKYQWDGFAYAEGTEGGRTKCGQSTVVGLPRQGEVYKFANGDEYQGGMTAKAVNGQSVFSLHGEEATMYNHEAGTDDAFMYQGGFRVHKCHGKGRRFLPDGHQLEDDDVRNYEFEGTYRNNKRMFSDKTPGVYTFPKERTVKVTGAGSMCEGGATETWDADVTVGKWDPKDKAPRLVCPQQQ